MRFRATNNGTYYIDLAKALSIQERRLHRQKKIYTVYGGFFVDSQGNRIDINVAPMTWVAKRSVNRGFNIWRKYVRETLALTDGGSSGKYSDFKVFLDNQHGTSTLLPKDAGGNDLEAGEWDYTTLYSKDPDVAGNSIDYYDLKITGQHDGSDPNWSRIGLMKSWLDSRALPVAEDQPNRTGSYATDPLSNLDDSSDVDDNRINNIAEEGDQSPYDEDQFFGIESANGGSNNLMRASVAQPTGTSQPVAPIHGFQALCGLMQIVVGEGSGTNAWELVLDVETMGESF
jgi:hypothetical protein